MWTETELQAPAIMEALMQLLGMSHPNIKTQFLWLIWEVRLHPLTIIEML